ncbi:Ig-like domain-containing protein [Companilactobacillus nodensis]|uniref:Cell surface SD repeat-containing protein n=1 Tax=Companilactobacillus nodensis DSM 19682 = JCM 14932 = NBRC 107160 TaxID=1423775 RepID=A0A0R1K7E3_9LACO|nr:Ig-like domain-containing protein [Companilactobacillus nodensis]KRK79376.1 cell surface SD repeat-containing protein [Companilactobacillus nodensis DSM 19682 = JCM 14932 = NBRC 107160]
MNNIKLKRYGLFLFVILLMLGVFSTQDTQAAEVGTPLTNSAFTATPEPNKFLNIWNTNGYDLQPEAVTYKVVGNEITLNTDAARSVWSVLGGVFDAPHYRWYKSDDGISWTEVPEWQNGHRKNLPIQTTEQSRTWYQLDTQYWNYLTGWVAKTHIYSTVAEVNAVNVPTNATGVSISTDSDYIYNNSEGQVNTTYAHAIVDPISSTGKVTWSVDNINLATVDSTGKITANDKSLSGVVKVTGTFRNMDTSFVIGTTYVQVGGGLDNQTVPSGQPATFTLRGDTNSLTGVINDNRIKIEWYKKAPGKTKAEYLGKSNSVSYTTANTTASDNGTQYQAKITLKEGSKSTTIKTNWATLYASY